MAETSGLDVWVEPIAVDFTGDGVLDLRWQDATACRSVAVGGFECEWLEFSHVGGNLAWAPTG